ncbi:MAG: hypothetical protein ACJA0U_003555 [Salibacteraceae bacterium]|jgi:hypothetical protein
MKFLKFIGPAVLSLALFSCSAEADTADKGDDKTAKTECAADCEKECCAKKDECGADCKKACCAKDAHTCTEECGDDCKAGHSYDEAHVCTEECSKEYKAKAMVKDAKEVIKDTKEIVKDVELPAKM